MDGTMGKWQFSLGALLAAVTLCGVLFGLARLVPVPDFSEADPLFWSGVLMVSVIGGATAAFYWFNS